MEGLTWPGEQKDQIGLCTKNVNMLKCDRLFHLFYWHYQATHHSATAPISLPRQALLLPPLYTIVTMFSMFRMMK